MQRDKSNNSFIEQFQSCIKNVGAGIEAFKKRANEIAVIVQPALDRLRANMQLIPERTKNLQRNLAKRGWYLLPQTPMTFYKFENESEETTDEVDSSMTQLVEHYLSEVESDLIAEFPDRAAIFREAFQAHRDGKYASAIALLLTQADGIVSDVLGRSFFSKERNSPDPRTRILIEDLQLDVYREMMLEPLMTRGGVSANEQELHLYPDSLHRHQILHGLDTSFPSKINSLKAISLVGYLGGLAKDIIVDAKAANNAANANLT